MAYQKGNLRFLATDVASQTYHRSPNHKVAEITIWSYVTDDSLAEVTAGDYYDRGHDQLSNYDLIFFMSEGGWGINRIETVDVTAGTVAFSQLAGGGGGSSAVTSVAGNIGNVTAGQLITAIDAITDTNFLTDAERAQIAAGISSPLTTQGDLYTRNATVDDRLPAPAENGKLLYRDDTTATGLAWQGQMVDVPNGGTVVPGRIARIPNGATISVPPAASFPDMNAGIRLAEGATSGTIIGVVGGTITLTSAGDFAAIESDGTSWTNYAAAGGTGGGASLPTANQGEIVVHDGTGNVALPPPAEDGKQLYRDSTTATGLAWNGQIIDVPNGGTIVPGFISRIPNGATVSVPAAASFANMNAGIRLAEGAATGSVTGVAGGDIALTANTDFAAIESDGTDWTRYAFGSLQPGVPFTPTSGTLVLAGGKVTIDNIPFAGAVQNDAFVVGLADGQTLRDNFINVQVYYESDGFVFLEFDSANPNNFSVPPQQFTIYKINDNSPVNVPGTITGIGGAPGLAPVAGGAPGASSTAATVDHRHELQTAANTPFTTTTDIAATNANAAIEEVLARADLPAIGADGSIVIQSGGDNVRHHLRIPVCFKFSQASGEIIRIRPSLPFQIDDVSLSVETGGPVNFTAGIDNGPGTASTNITGIVNVTANTVALTTANAAGANTGTDAQYLTVTLSGSATGYLEAHYRWTGV